MSRGICTAGLVVWFAAASASTAWASGATFAVTGQGATLGAAKETEVAGKEVIVISGKAELGKPFVLVAQGIVLPRGGKAEPGEPESGTWSFDEKQFKKLPADPKQADKTKIVVRLEPTAVGAARVRFVGVILGYERTFDVVLDVAAAKK